MQLIARSTFVLTRAAKSVNLDAVRPAAPWIRASAIGGGAFLLLHSLRRRSPWSFFGAALGTELLRIGITGRLLFDHHQTMDEEEDVVDLGSELSFPASDPPAY